MRLFSILLSAALVASLWLASHLWGNGTAMGLAAGVVGAWLGNQLRRVDMLRADVDSLARALGHKLPSGDDE